MSDANNYLVIGRVIDVYGLKGWVKVKSFTQPATNFLDYPQCFLSTGKHWQPLKIEAGKMHGKGLVVKFAGYDDRCAAEKLLKHDFAVKTEELAVLEEGDFYWHQLEKLQVFVITDEGERLLGKVDHLLETGSNDVLYIKPCEGSVDKRERLLPYRPEVVLKVDLAASKMLVDWDVEF
jgi:16S rRNA processing protein RimM